MAERALVAILQHNQHGDWSAYSKAIDDLINFPEDASCGERLSNEELCQIDGRTAPLREEAVALGEQRAIAFAVLYSLLTGS